ncbi:MAG: hypothetical protein IJA60_08675 [Clostridia bacterium]|nr:hypothetical protein [Clostridia bacterium]
MKKLFAITLVLLLSLSFTACFDGDEAESTAEVTVATTEDVNAIEPENVNNSNDALIDMNIIEVGQKVSFGVYEQDNDTSNGAEPIEWTVLDIGGKYALLISDFALDAKAYDSTGADGVTWENSTIRAWLNNDFLNTAFSDSEKTNVCDTTLENSVVDKVFLLSTSEIDEFFDANESRVVSATAYAKAAGVYTANGFSDDDASLNGTCRWWLRTAGENGAARVKNTGEVSLVGYDMGSDTIAVRPAMWIAIR